MGKFFNGNIRNNRDTMIKAFIIGIGIFIIIVIFVLIIVSNGKRNKQVILELKDSVEVSVNSELPKKADFFEKIENYDENKISVDYGECDIKIPGECEVTITAEGQDEKTVKLFILDTEAPVVKVNDLTISAGVKYLPADFVEECKDNADAECIVEFDTEQLDQDGNAIDYSIFTEPGEYTIRIIAKDKSGNIAKSQTVKLTITSDTPDVPDTPEEPDKVECKYGNLEYSKEDYPYPLTITVGDQENNCALNRDLWDNEAVQKKVNDTFVKDYNKLKKEFQVKGSEEFPNGSKIAGYPRYIAVLNKDLKGLVGYAIYVKVYAIDIDSKEVIDDEKNLKIEYYINSDGTREYITNVYNIGK